MDNVQKLAVPIAIVLAGALIAAALYFATRSNAPVAPGADAKPTVAQKIRSIEKSDHVRGNPNAPVVIVEFSDTECPFCKNFHATMKQVMGEYGEAGKVAW